MKLLIIIISIYCIFLLNSCGTDPDLEGVDFKREMKSFVHELSVYAKNLDSNFIIIPQNGQELLTENGEEDGPPDLTYINAIDGQGREDFYYGYNRDNKATPDRETDYMKKYLDIGYSNGVVIMVTDYCSDHEKMDDSYSKNNNNHYISFAANSRELDRIPDYPASIYNENADSIGNLSEAENFLYLINPERYSSKNEYIQTIASTNYDVLLMDYFFGDGEEFTSEEITELKNKANGGKRLVVSYMSIGEAEDYRFYWKSSWKKGNPGFIYDENPDWEGNYKVKYWDDEWKDIIFGTGNSYLDKIINKGFDGTYLDIIDAFEYFEDL